MVQFPPSAWNQIINGGFWFGTVIVLLIIFRKNKIKAYFSLLIACIFMVINNLFVGLSYMYQIPLFLGLGSIFFAFAIIFEARFIDLVWYEKMSIARTSVSMVILTTIVISVLLPDSFTTDIENGFTIPAYTTFPMIVSLITLLAACALACHWLFMSWKKSPSLLKKPLRSILYAALIIGPVSILLGILFMSVIVFTIVADIGLLVMAYLALKNPQILYLLPFTVDRLIIIDKESGLTIFTYEWAPSNSNPLLIGGLLKALQDLSFEALEKGFFESIKFEKGTMLMSKGQKVLAGLITTKSSDYLVGSLKNLTNEFEKQFCEQNYDPNCVEGFNNAKYLVQKYLGNIPSRM